MQVSALEAQLSSMTSDNEQLEDRATSFEWCLQRLQATRAAIIKVGLFSNIGTLLQATIQRPHFAARAQCQFGHDLPVDHSQVVTMSIWVIQFNELAELEAVNEVNVRSKCIFVRCDSNACSVCCAFLHLPTSQR